MKKPLLVPLGILLAALGYSQTLKPSADAPRHVEILFLGAPTANHPGHDPVERYRVLKKALGVDGINLTYTEDLNDIRPDVLDRYDGVMLYGNWQQNEAMDPPAKAPCSVTSMTAARFCRSIAPPPVSAAPMRL